MAQIGKDYADEIERQNNLSKDQLALDREKAKIKKDIEGKGGFLPDDEITRLAKGTLAANARRSAAGRAGGGGWRWS